MNPISYLLVKAIDIYIILVIIRAVLSWFPVAPDSPFFAIYIFIIKITEPLLGWFRIQLRKIAPTMMIDFSPLIVIILLQILRSLIIG